jgi:hypothetical protein
VVFLEREIVKKTGWIWLGMSALVLFSLSPVPIQVWAWQGEVSQDHVSRGEGFQPAGFPLDAQPIRPLLAGDLQGDGGQERLALTSGLLTVLKGSQILWQSPHGWQVDQAAITDLDHDGKPEVTLLVWRPFAPWPIDRYIPNPGRISTFHDQHNQSCHLILIGWRGGAMREIWAGSALAEPVQSFSSAGPPGKEILITLDSLYALARTDPARAMSAWEWNGFGFSLVSRLTGPFSKAVTLSSQPPTQNVSIFTSRR